MKKVYMSKLGENKGNKRVWIESNRLNETEFTPESTIMVNISKGRVEITSQVLGTHRVSQRRGRPVIDINNKKLTDAFEDCKMISIRIYSNRIIIEQLNEDKLQQEAREKAKNPLTFGEIFAGGGTLHSTLAKHFESKFAIDIEDKYLENLEANFPKTLTINGSVANVNWSALPKCDVLAAGIPCECYSPVGVTAKQANGQEAREAGDTGHLGFYVLEAIRAIRPGIILVEEVKNFKNSAMADILRGVLADSGYHISEDVLRADDFGGLTKRERYVMIASAYGKISLPQKLPKGTQTVESILEIPLDKREWLTEHNNKSIAHFKEKEIEQKKKGNGFKMTLVNPSDTCGVPTITKGYAKYQITNPILKHPSLDAYSFFTPNELKRINGLDKDFILPETKTTACEIVGQGVSADLFSKVVEQIVAAKESSELCVMSA